MTHGFNATVDFSKGAGKTNASVSIRLIHAGLPISSSHATASPFHQRLACSSTSLTFINESLEEFRGKGRGDVLITMLYAIHTDALRI